MIISDIHTINIIHIIFYTINQRNYLLTFKAIIKTGLLIKHLFRGWNYILSSTECNIQHCHSLAFLTPPMISGNGSSLWVWSISSSLVYLVFFFFLVVRRLVLESTINCDCFLIALRFGTSVSSSPLSSSSTISRNHLNGHDRRMHTSPVYPVLWSSLIMQRNREWSFVYIT